MTRKQTQQNNAENYHVYMVIPELKTIHALLAPILTTTIAVAFIKKRKIKRQILTIFAVDKKGIGRGV